MAEMSWVGLRFTAEGEAAGEVAPTTPEVVSLRWEPER